MTAFSYLQICERFFNKPLLIAPPNAQTIAAFLQNRIGAGSRRGNDDDDGGSSAQYFKGDLREDGSVVYHKPRASRFMAEWALDDNGRPLPFRRTPEGTGIVTVVGELVNRGAWIGASSGLVSYEGVKHQLSQAAADPRTKAIVLDLETPGGEAVGAFEAAAAVREAAKVKPVVAVVNGMAASAGYALASGASRIVTMPTGVSGSIGVVMVHFDYSQFLADEGVKPTLIFAGAHKVDGNPFEELPEAVRTDFQREVDAFYSKFVETVAAGRRGLSTDAIRSTEARTFLGDEAVRVGLADSVGTLESVLTDFSRAHGRAQSSKKGASMSETHGAPAAENAGQHEMQASIPVTARITTAAELCAAYPALTSAIGANAATAERERILGIEAIAGAGHEAMIAGFKADGRTTPEQAAFAILKAEKETRGLRMDQIRGVEAETGRVGAAPPPSPAATQSAAAEPQTQTREQMIAAYEASPALRAEFPTADLYVAFMKAEQSGKVRRFGRKG